MSVITCVMCGEKDERHNAHAVYCWKCLYKGGHALRPLASKAGYLVHKAVKKGQLMNLKETHVQCVDCGERAMEYDHRDYRKPLEVDAVCRSCNRNRGQALPYSETLKDYRVGTADYKALKYGAPK